MRFLHYFYYRVYQTCVAISDDFLNDLKPFAVVWIIQLLFVFEGFMWFTPLTGIKFYLKPIPAIIVGVVFLVFNFILFPHNKIIKKESKEFRHYPKTKRNLLDALIVLIILGTLVFTIFSFYEFSKMDWSKYRQ